MRLVDTSVAIDHLRQGTEATSLLTALLRAGVTLLASELVRFELLAGLRSGELEDLEAFCELLEWVPVTENVARTAGELALRYRPAHSGIDDVDFLLAATSLVHDAPLLTRNVRRFPMFPGLEPPY